MENKIPSPTWKDYIYVNLAGMAFILLGVIIALVLLSGYKNEIPIWLKILIAVGLPVGLVYIFSSLIRHEN